MNDDILLTREQIGTALEYVDPGKAIKKIHFKHKDRLEPLCVRIKLSSGEPQFGANLNKSEEQERIYYTERGIMELCRWSRQPKANQFMDWCWDVIEKYRNGQISTNSKDLEELAKALTTLTSSVTEMQKDISTLKEQQTQIQKALPKKKLSYWDRKMFPKYDLLMDYFNVSRTKLYNNLYIELQNQYPDIDLNQIQEDYCYENGIESCYTMDVIEHTKDVRTRFENMVEELLNRYDLKEKEAESLNKETIFV